MKPGTTEIEDTYAEAFGMRYCRLLVTAADDYWLDIACRQFTGNATSVIGCDVEAGVESFLSPAETPDGLPGAMILCFAFSSAALGEAVVKRVGQNLLTCPTASVYDGLPDAADRLPLGKLLRFFGDGYQKSKQVDGRRYWRIPIMQGEFLVQDTVGYARGIAGGNIILQAATPAAALGSARRAVAAIAPLGGVITPFPGGVVASGSKVGSRYSKLRASTNHEFCPSLIGRVNTQLAPGTQCAYEIVIDGIDEPCIARAMLAALEAAVGPDILRISAGNYGGSLGKYHFWLRRLEPMVSPASSHIGNSTTGSYPINQ